MSSRLVHIGSRGGTAYQVVDDPDDPTKYALRPVPGPNGAEAITGDADWRKNTVVLTAKEAGRLRKLRPTSRG